MRGDAAVDGVTGKPMIHEAVGVFHDPAALQAAISDLASAGVDRAEMSLLAQDGVLEGAPAKDYASARQTADDPAAPRQAIFADTDLRQGRTLLTSMASVIAAFAASGIVVMTGGAALAALAAALGAGGGAGVVGALAGRRAGAAQEQYLAEQMAHGGILLWTKITRPEREAQLLDILTRHCATDVHVHDVPVD
jgi:hypothetical protein